MFFLIDKPKGISSFKAIKDFAKENNIKKIGHTGTLDPLATGALLVATDDDTKFISYISNKNKTYIVDFELGKTSDTYDCEGEIRVIDNKKHEHELVKKTIEKFIGAIMQIPPNFSAKKINGQRAYKIAREGKDFKLKPVQVRIHSIKNFKELATNTFSFEVEVSNGTYIRSLINDIGQAMGTGGVMTELRRTKISHLTLHSVKQEVDIKDIINLPVIDIENIKPLLEGKEIKINVDNGLYLISFHKVIVGIGEIINNLLKTKKIMGNKIQKLL